jgi:hypothetical protein
MPQWDRDGHVAKGRLGLVDSAEGALLVDLGLGLGLAALRLYVLAAFLLVARKGGYGEGGSRGIRQRGGKGGLLGGVGERQGG